MFLQVKSIVLEIKYPGKTPANKIISYISDGVGSCPLSSYTHNNHNEILVRFSSTYCNRFDTERIERTISDIMKNLTDIINDYSTNSYVELYIIPHFDADIVTFESEDGRFFKILSHSNTHSPFTEFIRWCDCNDYKQIIENEPFLINTNARSFKITEYNLDESESIINKTNIRDYRTKSGECPTGFLDDKCKFKIDENPIYNL